MTNLKKYPVIFLKLESKNQKFLSKFYLTSKKVTIFSRKVHSYPINSKDSLKVLSLILEIGMGLLLHSWKGI